MNNTLTGQAIDWREGRRLRGWELIQKGWKQTEVAEALGVTQGAVSQWVKRAKERGIWGLKRRKAPGGQARLSVEQKAQLPLLLEQGAEAFGFRGDIWTCGRIAQVVRHTFGVSYHPAHVSRLLKECGWSLQKPVRRASQRDEAAIERWKSERQVKKKPWRRVAPWCL